ncbi:MULTISPECIES: hypothetical protein [Staphylococcus]|uniref:Uncharacterized protein n=9 Tax=Staphylococcus aureus TaxID=1280 RepID=Q2FW48_STAA8|nr:MULTISPECIES: hypothetical protein [Staphylococcus]YP_500937.1 hypothetical protein SAOUHSC_02469 [Staphylococcus aureus subsp. aureus NCTC 8325]MBN4913308.1 hypothetical protein [Staphylococcus sp. EG-SA-13]HAR4232164.1 hypothetical protein [Staphylococcus aureus ADL-331]HAR4236120.1 hypothetical protein [Staphylococcus aureus ADL-121]HDH6252741.1 hypothetical protein [Staphylococcus aureus LTCF-9-33]HDH6258899.1 hypothetical protein [Staphylococcus aureus LTCF-8-31]HDH6260854.1 hypothet
MCVVIMRDVGLIDVEDCYDIFGMWCLVNGGLKLSFYGGLKMLFYVGLEFVVLWRYKKPQQDLDLTVTYTFHTYIYRLVL